MASQDLGGLGNRVGPLVTYHWYPVLLSLMAIPWILAATLLRLPFNRSANTGWLAAPPLFLVLTQEMISSWFDLDYFYKQVLDPVIFLSLYSITVFWLLLPFLSVKRKWLTCLKNAPVFLLSTLVALAFVFWTSDVGGSEQSYYLIAGGILALANVAICSLQPWICRHSYSRWRIVLGFLFSALLVWLVVLVGAAILNNYQDLTQGEMLLQLVLIVLSMTGITFALQLPFLLLSLFHPFFRARLLSYLQNVENRESTVES